MDQHFLQSASTGVSAIGHNLLEVEKILIGAPTNIDALALGLICARKLGICDWPEKWLTHALEADYTLDLVREERARVREDSGNFQGALDDYQSLLSSNPNNYIARLFLSRLIYDLGDHECAAKHAHTAIHNARCAGRWFDSKTTEPTLAYRVKKALELVQTSREILINRVLAPLIVKYGNDALNRLDSAVKGWFSGTSGPKNKAQKPKQFFVAGLSDSPFLDEKIFPWFARLKSETSTIRAEAQVVFQSNRFCEYLQLSDEANRDEFLANNKGVPQWQAYFFYRHGRLVENARLECPHTSSILADLPLVDIPGFAPEVCFSALTPGTRILPHYGDSNIRTVVHLPLIVSGDCKLKVGDEIHSWCQGEAVAFDDTFLHEAWNLGTEVRLVLLMDVWHPELTLVECEVLAVLLPELGAFHSINKSVR